MAAFRQAAATLTVRRGPGVGRSFTVDAPAITIGRQEQCDFQVNDRWVSRRHARITWGGAGYLIEDLDTVNGTFVNGERVSRPRALSSGDILKLGSEVELDFRLRAPAPVVQRPDLPDAALAPERELASQSAAAPADDAKQEAQKAASSALTSSIVGLFICGIVLEPGAISQARKARKVLGPGEPGYGKAVAAEVIGWIGLLLWAAGLIYQFSNMQAGAIQDAENRLPVIADKGHTLSVGTPWGSNSVIEKREKMGKFNLRAGSTIAQNGVRQRARLFYLVMALVLGGILLASRFVEPSGLPNVCLPDMLLGVPCITTGLTRAFNAISLGELHIALAYHPLSLFLYGLMVLHLLLALLRLLGWRARLIKLPNRVQAMIWGTIGLLVLSWIPRVLRLVILQ